MLSRSTIRHLFGVHVHFFMKNEIISEDIQKVPKKLVFTFLIFHSYNQWREPGW